VQGAGQSAVNESASGGHGAARLEQVPGSLDDRIRLLPVDSAWYGAVLVPDSGDTYCLLTILPRDEAAGYATSHRVSINQVTGTLEVSRPAALKEAEPYLRAAAGPDSRRLFADVSDADLTRLGRDADPRPLVRLLVNDAELDALQSMLPAAQYTALQALASGMTVEEAHAEAARLLAGARTGARIDSGDLVAAMERTSGEVAFVSDQEELQDILAHPFAAWRTFLPPSQREVAYRPSYCGPAQVTGGRGTGKTVTVLHRAAFLAARAGSVPLLLTTFNGNLADALQAQLDLLIRDPAVRGQVQ